MAALLAGCTAGPIAGDPPPPLGHVHGLDYDAASDRLYVASHTGLWWTGFGGHASEGGTELTLVEGLNADVMGFTVTAPGSMVASGHPASTSDPSLPANLGLVRSDGGEEWNAVSLRDEADFHDIATVEVGGELWIYGYDSTVGSIRVSDDGGQNWEDGARIDLRDMAVRGREPHVALAATADGLMPRSFQEVPGAPALVLIDSAESQSHRFFGVDTGGAVWSLPMGTEQWTRTGTIAQPLQAFAFVSIDDREILVAVSDRRVIASNDAGAHWYSVADIAPER